MYWNDDEVEVERDDEGNVVVDENKSHTQRELEAMADAMLRDFAKRELCRECLDDLGEEVEGEETGHIEHVPQFKDGEPVLNPETGRQIIMAFPEKQCPRGHTWYKGEGKARQNNGKNPVLFEEHLAQRRRREIYTAEGTPDPNIVSGIYNRTHPQGRKVNTDKQRKEHGASFFR